MRFTLAVLTGSLFLLACGGGSSSNLKPVPVQATNVVVVMEENTSYSEVIGNPAMPYLNSLANQYSLATQYFANAHPSIGNYFMLTTGQLITNNDAFNGTVSADNLVRQFIKDGKSWKAYIESIPSAGYLGGDAYPYLRHHNPFSFFMEVTSDPAQAANIVPFTTFASDLAAGTLPNFSFVVPNAENDAHDCPGGGNACAENDKLAAADQWLQANIAPLIASGSFSNTLLVIVFDEAASSDKTDGGGHVAAILVGPKVKAGYQGSGMYQHQDLLHTIGTTLQLSSIPGEGATASGMAEFF